MHFVPLNQLWLRFETLQTSNARTSSVRACLFSTGRMPAWYLLQAEARGTAVSSCNDLYPRIIVCINFFHAVVSETLAQASRSQSLPALSIASLDACRQKHLLATEKQQLQRKGSSQCH